jgi:hypothetical protein
MYSDSYQSTYVVVDWKEFKLSFTLIHTNTYGLIPSKQDQSGKVGGELPDAAKGGKKKKT